MSDHGGLTALLVAVQIHDSEVPDLAGLSPADACDVLHNRATVLDVSKLSTEWQRKIATQEPGMVEGVSISTFLVLFRKFRI